ncbi:MAG TPA: F0F1 ATP synthase subunit epsilon [Steroidobacteraceae bacterium]|jgi:F-type H+-transporting ATPase subunit epsilon|nr:F0F1 ATP synthase subunit epsilon [Steroidobacteraceae bacterium]
MFMHLKVLLPYGIFADQSGVTRIVAETRDGSCGLLPRRLDCVAALVPGILIYQCDAQPETFVAVDEGVLVKSGQEVLISVRRAVGGTDLAQLRSAVAREFLTRDAEEKSLRSSLLKIESGLISRLAALHRG